MNLTAESNGCLHSEIAFTFALGQQPLLLLSRSAAGLGRKVLALQASGPATAVWGLEGEVNVLLRVQTHDKRWHGHNLLANAAEGTGEIGGEG